MKLTYKVGLGILTLLLVFFTSLVFSHLRQVEQDERIQSLEKLVSSLSPLDTSIHEKVKEISRVSRQESSIVHPFNLRFGGIILFLSILFWFFIDRTLRKTMAQALSTLKDISNGDLNKRLDLGSKDEFAVLFHEFNGILTSLGTMIQKVKQVATNTENISLNLATISEESTAELEEIRANIEMVNDKSIHLDEEIISSNRLAQEVKDFLSNVVQLISTQISSITEITIFIDKLSSLIKHTIKISETKLEITDALEKTASEGELRMRESMAIISKVSSSANVIKEMSDVINDIADRTNILAMNAAIEGAHAGQSGKGFTIVAYQIRKLAEDTSKNSREISKSIKTILKDIQLSKDSTSRTDGFFMDMVQGIKEVMHSIRDIKESMQSLSSRSDQVIESLSTFIGVTSDVKLSAREMNKKVEHISDSMENLNFISTETRGGMEEITTSVQQLYKAAEHVSNAGIKNNEGISEIERLIERFKINDKQLPNPASF
ncbi:MAG TPA: methyl-accepting chemotaxis protein [Spirochaetes bacterium]|nr:methyl-accepting chemotaxis protein [Spirochaetota bacterium]